MLKFTVATAKKLVDIASKPGATDRVQFIAVQHVTRNLLRHRRDIWAERNVFRREAEKLKCYLPSVQRQVDELFEKSRTHRGLELDGNSQVLMGIGSMLLQDREGIYEKLGFEAMCDLLSINPVHRAEARRRQGDRSLAGLIYVSRMENSVTSGLDRWGGGGPLFEACFAAVVEWLRTAPKEYLPDLFGPESPFAGAQVVRIDSETLQ
jgi:hypothetical protein